MDAKRTIAGFLVLFGMLAATGFGIYYGGALLSRHLSAVGESTLTVGLFAAIVLLLSARIISGGPYRAARFQANYNRRDQKRVLYRRVLNYFRQYSAATLHNIDNEVTADQTAYDENELLLIASPLVIRRYTHLRSALPESANELTPLFKQLLLAMRQDLGERNFGLDSPEVMQHMIHPMQDTPETGFSESLLSSGIAAK